jgi:hypothetical protein
MCTAATNRDESASRRYLALALRHWDRYASQIPLAYRQMPSDYDIVLVLRDGWRRRTPRARLLRDIAR